MSELDPVDRLIVGGMWMVVATIVPGIAHADFGEPLTAVPFWYIVGLVAVPVACAAAYMLGGLAVVLVRLFRQHKEAPA